MATHIPHIPSNVTDSGQHFIINPVTRVIEYDSDSKLILMQYDANSERITFEAPRYIDGHDMMNCDVVQIHYINTGSNNTKTEGIDSVSPLTLIEGEGDEEDIITFTWLIPANATQHAGIVNFIVRFVCTDANAEPIYAWNTAICSDIQIDASLSVSQGVVDNNLGILEEWYNKLKLDYEWISEGEKRILVIKDFEDQTIQSPDLRGPVGPPIKLTIGDVEAKGNGQGATADVEKVADGEYKLNLGLPKGNTGNTPNLTIGTVVSLEPDETATASFSGDAENPVLNLGIPRGSRDSIISIGNNKNVKFFMGTQEEFNDIPLEDKSENLFSVITDDPSEEQMIQDVEDLKEQMSDVDTIKTSQNKINEFLTKMSEFEHTFTVKFDADIDMEEYQHSNNFTLQCPRENGNYFKYVLVSVEPTSIESTIVLEDYFLVRIVNEDTYTFNLQRKYVQGDYFQDLFGVNITVKAKFKVRF